MVPSKVILLACGSFNPPTNMHLRMFEIARDNLNKMGTYSVVGGIVSPVHDSYGKKELVSATYRCEMLKLALLSSEWVKLSDWECNQETWCRTRAVLQYHQNVINALISENINSPNHRQYSLENESWLQDLNLKNETVQVKLLCGADLLESFSVPGLWSDDDIATIVGDHGLVVITRHNSNPQQFIYESDVLTRYQQNITIVPEWIINDVSSTKVRRALRRQESVKYLIDDRVIEFIKKNGLYGCLNENDVSMTSLTASKNVILNLRSMEDLNRNRSETDSCGSKAVFIKPQDEASIYGTLETFQSRAEIKFTADKNEENVKRSTPYPGTAVQVALDGQTTTEKSKKVGFKGVESIDYQLVHYDICETPSNWMHNTHKVIAVIKKGSETQKPKVTEIDTIPKPVVKCQKSPRRSSKTPDLCKNKEKTCSKSKTNRVLKRSNSDAVMSDREKNDLPDVKIQFTKDGVKVISDKESIV